MTKDCKPICGVFAYRKEIPVETLEIIDFSDTKTADNWFEMIVGGLNSKLDYNREFNQGGYAATVRHNENLSNNRNQAKVTFFTYDMEDDSSNSRRGVNINLLAEHEGTQFEHAISCVKDAYEEVDFNDEVANALRDIRMMIPVLMCSEGINLKLVIKSALQQVPMAVNKLKYVCENFELLGESIKVVLGSGIEGILDTL